MVRLIGKAVENTTDNMIYNMWDPISATGANP